MPVNTNSWNKLRYTIYTPFYDLLVGRIFYNSRKKAIGLLQVNPTDKVLLIGAGTGLDLEFLPATATIFATDITPAMVSKMEKRNEKLKLNARFEVMDGQALTFPDNEFDKIILHLILAVIPDPVACLQEAERVLKPGGKIVVFDKFLKDGQQPTMLRKVANKITNLFFSNINRNFETILAQTNLQILHTEEADFGGNFRIILLQKKTV